MVARVSKFKPLKTSILPRQDIIPALFSLVNGSGSKTNVVLLLLPPPESVPSVKILDCTVESPALFINRLPLNTVLALTSRFPSILTVPLFPVVPSGEGSISKTEPELPLSPPNARSVANAVSPTPPLSSIILKLPITDASPST